MNTYVVTLCNDGWITFTVSIDKAIERFESNLLDEARKMFVFYSTMENYGYVKLWKNWVEYASYNCEINKEQ